MQDKVCYTFQRHTLESFWVHTGILLLPQAADVPPSISLLDMGVVDFESGEAHWKLICHMHFGTGMPHAEGPS